MFVIQSHRQEGLKNFMKHQTTASVKLYVDLSSLIIPASHLGQYDQYEIQYTLDQIGYQCLLQTASLRRGDRRRGAGQR